MSAAVGTLGPPVWRKTSPHLGILVVDTSDQRRAALGDALRAGLDAEVQLCATLPERDEAWDVVIVDAQAVPHCDTDAVYRRFDHQRAQGTFIVRVPSSERNDVARWLERGAHHLICREEPHADADAVSAVRKLLWTGAAGPECYLQQDARTWRLSLSDSREKTQVFELCRDMERILGLGKRKREALETICEEFVTNAFYNAPVDASGARRFAHFSRRDPVKLDPGETIEVLMAADSERVAVSVADPFGSILPETVAGYLSKCLHRGDDQVDSKRGGAGLGLFFVYQSVSHLAVNIAPGRRTEMIGFIDLSVTAGSIQRRAHSLGLFVTT
jgi:DNA-binding NarL/FixJ family response regulator